MASLGALRKSAGIRTLLSPLNSNPKVAKNEKLNVSTAVLHLAPGDMSGHEVCPKRSPGCSAACLHFAGNPVYQDAKTKARIKKTQLFFSNRNLFMNILALEMVSHILNVRKKGMTPAFRLNATSDIVWEKKTFILFPETAAIINKKLPEADITAKTIIALFPATIFYDYTAIPNRSAPGNYYLTFSLKEQNLHDARGAIRQGFNIAVVFPVGVLPDRPAPIRAAIPPSSKAMTGSELTGARIFKRRSKIFASLMKKWTGLIQPWKFRARYLKMFRIPSPRSSSMPELIWATRPA
ncbi:MAG: GP88 family protein [Parasphingorhabdus sp.]